MPSRCPFLLPGCAVCSHSLRMHLSTPPLFSAASGHLALLTIQSLPCPVHGRMGPQRRPPPFAAATFQPIGLLLRRRPLPACSAQSDSAWLPAIQWTCSLWVRSQTLCSEFRLVVRSYRATWQPWEVMCDGVQFLDCGLQMPFDLRFLS